MPGPYTRRVDGETLAALHVNELQIGLETLEAKRITVWVPGSIGFVSSVGVGAAAQHGSGTVMDFPDASAGVVHYTAYRPSAATSLVSVSLRSSSNATAGDHSIGVTVDASGTGQAYNARTDVASFLIPANPSIYASVTTIVTTAFDGLVSAAGDHMGIQINRDGAGAADTAAGTFRLLGIIFEWAT